MANYLIRPLNFRNRVVLFHNKVDDRIKWTVFDLDKKEAKVHEVNKPEGGGEYNLR